jgi:hypothetical protein
VPGIKHCSDGDRMNGTQLSSVAIEPYPSGVPLLSTPPTIVGAPRRESCSPPCPAFGRAASPSRSPTSGDSATRRRRLHRDLGATRVVVPAGQHRRGTLAQGHRDRYVRGGTAVATSVDAAVSRRHPAGRPPGSTSITQILGNAQAGQTSGRDMDGLAVEVHVPLAALPQAGAPASDPRGRAAPDSHPPTSARRSRSS